MKGLSKTQLTSKVAKQTWKDGMKQLYPDFKAKLWANGSYRIAHPQPRLNAGK